MNIPSQNIAILGAGAWGTAVATVLAHNGHNVLLWCYEEKTAYDINHHHINHDYLPGITLSPRIVATNDLQATATYSNIMFQAIPVKAIGHIFKAISHLITNTHIIINLSKGIEQQTLHVPLEIIAQTLTTKPTYMALSGPNFAQDLARRVPTSTTLASHDTCSLASINSLLNNHYFSVSHSLDLLGIQICGAFKNVIALGLGIAHGAHLQENTKAALITQGLHELSLLCTAHGGELATVYGLAGVGDLILCCTGTQSRNFNLGISLGEGTTLSTIMQKHTHLPEGINTIQSLEALRIKYNLSLPFCENIFNVVFHDAPRETIYRVNPQNLSCNA